MNTQEIKENYTKLNETFYNSLINSIEKQLELIKTYKEQEHIRANTLFNAYINDNSNTNRYAILNGIFGPNEINSTEWTNTFAVDCQKRQLEELRETFYLTANT